MKIKVFTHTDLDGVGSPILANRAFGSDNVDYELCNYNEINDKVEQFTEIGHYKNYDKIFITDISVDKEVAELIQGIEFHNDHQQWYLFDHHSTADWLNEYDWAYVVSQGYHGKGTSGTSLFYDHLIQAKYLDKEDYNAAQFTELVRVYDTWEWDRDQNLQAKKLNDLLYIIGQSRFIKRFSDDVEPVFTDGEELILEIERNSIDSYIKKKAKEAFLYPIKGYVALAVFNERYHSELGNTLAKANPHVDLVIMINAGSNMVSYRTVKEDVNVAELAKVFGGGGHPKASGSTFDKDLVYTWIDEVFRYSDPESKEL